MDPKYEIILDSKYNSPAGSFALALDVRTANQLKEVYDKLNTGAKQLEVQGTFSKQLESIPDQHLDEMRRQAKIVGSKLTFHGPIEEPSGFDGQRNEWNEENRKHVELQFDKAIERAHKLDPDGNIIVTIHSTAQLPEMIQREKVKDKEEVKSFFAVDSISGKVNQLKDEKSEFPETKEGKIRVFDPNKELERRNKEIWDNQMFNFTYHLDLAESRYGREKGILGEAQKLIDEGKITKEELIKTNPEIASLLQADNLSSKAGDVFLKNSYNDLKTLFNYAYKSAKEQSKEGDIKKLDNFRKVVQENFGKIEKNDRGALSTVVREGLRVLQEDIDKPKILKNFNNFVIDKSSDTFSNIALNSYKKFGDTSPIISVENPPAGGGISRAEDLKELVEKSREKLSNKLSSEGYTKREAKEIAEKIIGVTWDVGHINMIRKYGYEDKDLLKQAEIIKPFLKHIHLSDNFGFEHTELPMGMGNVPLKETAKIFGSKFNKLTKAIETGDWYQHFKVTPFPYELAAFGSPLGKGFEEKWNTVAWSYSPYFYGYGTINPDIHHSIYGRGFAALPQELGGQIPGKESSRATGTPLA